MLLNRLGQPVALDAYEAGQLEIEDEPIIVTGIHASLDNISANWTGTIYSNECILAEIKKNLSDDLQHRATFQVCEEGYRYEVTLPEGKQIYLSLFGLSSSSEEVVIFLIEDGSVSFIASGELPPGMDCFENCLPLINAIKCGIDSVFFDDTVYFENMTEEEAQIRPQHDEVYLFIYMICPRNIIGYYGSSIPVEIYGLRAPEFSSSDEEY